MSETAHGPSLRLEEFLRFNQELEALVRTRLPLSDGLRRLGGESSLARRLDGVARSVAEGLDRGRSLSQAVEESGHAFPRLYVEMIRVGEKSESLSTVLNAVVRSAHRQLEVRSAFKTMLFYPLFVLILAMSITLGVAIFVVPHFIEIYAQLGAELPGLTLLIVTLSRALSENGIVVLLIPVLFVLLARAFVSLPFVRRWFHSWVYWVPMVGPLMSIHHTGLWCRALGELVGGGVPLDESLDWVSEVVPNHTLRGISQRAAVDVRRGGRLAQSMEGTRAIPPSFQWMISRAEERGDLRDTLRELADLADAKAGLLRQRAFVYFEPLILVGVGLFIGILVVSLYLPLFSIPRLIGF